MAPGPDHPLPFENRRSAGAALAATAGRTPRPRVMTRSSSRFPAAACRSDRWWRRTLGAPLDVIVVRKLGVPSQPELAMGAIGEDGVRVLEPRGDRRAHGSAPTELADGRGPRAHRAASDARARLRAGHRVSRSQPDASSWSTTASQPGAPRERRSMSHAHTVPRESCSRCRSRRRDTVRELATVADEVVVRRDAEAVPRHRAVVPRLPPDHRRRGRRAPAAGDGVRQPSSARRVRSTVSRPGPPAVGGSDVGRDRRERRHRRRRRRPERVEVVATFEERDRSAGDRVRTRAPAWRASRSRRHSTRGRRAGRRGGRRSRPRRAPRSARSASTTGATTSSSAASATSPVAPGRQREVQGEPGGVGRHRSRRRVRSPGTPGTGASTRRARPDRPRRCPGCRCRDARPSRRSAPVRRARSSAAAAIATLLNRQKP